MEFYQASQFKLQLGDQLDLLKYFNMAIFMVHLIETLWE